MSTFKKLASDTALYGVSTILARSINFALAPIQTYAFLKPAELASNVSIYAWIGVLLAIYTLGLETAYFRFAARAKGDERADERQLVFNRSTSLLVLSGLIPAFFTTLFADQIAGLMGYPGEGIAVMWGGFILAIDTIMAVPFARLRVENKAKQFVLAKVLNILINVALNVFFIILCKDIAEGDYLPALRPVASFIYRPEIGPAYILLANLIANGLYLVLLRNAFSGFRFTLDWVAAQSLLAYSFPIMLTGLSGVLNQLTDRLLLRRFLPDGFYPGLTADDALGIYGNCLKLSIFMALAINSFKFAADPFFFSRAEDKNSPKLLADVTKWFIIVCAVLWVGVSLNLDIIGKLTLSPKYRIGLGVVPILLLANLLLGVYYNISFWFKLSDKTSFGTLITVVGTAVTALFNILLIPKMGYMGCAWAFLASSFVMMALCYGLGEKYYPVPYRLGSALFYIGSAAVLIYGSSLVQIPNLWISVPYHMVLFVLYLGIIAVVERDTVRLALQRIRRRPAQRPAPSRSDG